MMKWGLAARMNLFKEVEEIRERGEKAALCIVVNTKGSTPRKVGSKMIVMADGSIVGTIGGGNLEKEVIENAVAQIDNKASKLYKHDLLHQHGMCCGGSVEIYIEPIQKMKRLYIFGAGHTGHALAKFSVALDFDTYVIDDRKEYIDNVKVEGVNKMHMEYKKALPVLPFSDETYVTIMTYDHAFDRDILAYCLTKPHAYLGMIGSQRKIEITKKKFIEAKIAGEKELDQVDMPMGLEIEAETPDEIAVSILAKLIQVKNADS